MHRFNILLSYVCIYVLWSTTPFAIKLSVQGFTPWFVVGTRFFIGGLLLLAVTIVAGRLRELPWALPSRRQLLGAVVTGVILLAGGNGMVTVALRHVDSYLAALILAAIPVAVILFDRLVLGVGSPMVALFGSLTGICGIALLLFDASSGSVAPNLYLLFSLLGMLLWALGTTLSKRFSLPKDPILTSAIQLSVVGGLVLLLQVVVLPGSPVSDTSGVATSGAATSGAATGAPPLSSLLALGYLTLFGSLGLAAYSFLLRHEPNYRVTTYALVTPLFAVLIGLLIGNERPLPMLLPGAFLILAGTALVLYGPMLSARLRR